MNISVIIATKNRHNHLLDVLRCLDRQTVPPSQIVVVDQSNERLSAPSFASALANYVGDKVYVYDPSIPGAASARNVGMSKAKGDVWLFLDDDVQFEETLVANLLEAYASLPLAAGIGGVIVNYSRPRTLDLLFRLAFETGPFWDDRQPIYWKAGRLQTRPIKVSRFTGAIMSFRASNLRFDEALVGRSLAEDIDFSIQNSKCGPVFIVPTVRVIHLRSDAGKGPADWLGTSMQAASYLYTKHWRGHLHNRVSFYWLRFGYAIAAVLSCLKRRSSNSWLAMQQGVQTGRALAGWSLRRNGVGYGSAATP